MNNELTRQDIDDMLTEIAQRKTVIRKELLEHVKVAREQGDLSENFEYYAAKKEKNQNESRIRYLERMVRTAKVVDDHAAEDEIGIGKTITLYIPEDEETEVYKIVTTVRQDSLNGLISIESPLGKQLMGHKVGDKINIKVNDKFSYEVVVQKIENTTVTSDDKIRDF